jgi:glycosyltransferase 2 family protein
MWIGLAFSLILIALFLHGTNFREIGNAFADANYLLAFLSLPVYFLAAWFRALRWRYLLRPMKAIGMARLYPIVIIGFMANNLIPARVGELVRAYILREKEQVSMSAGLGTIVVDRVFDALTLLLFLILAGLFATVSPEVRTLAIVMAALFGVGVVIMYVLVTSESRSRRAVDVVVRLVPGRAKGRAQGLADSFLEGLQSLRSPRAMAGAWVTSVVSWLLEATMYYMVGEAFGLELGFHIYLLVAAAANLAITLPTPGGVGPFELGTRWALAPFDVASNTVRAYAIVLHALLLFPVIALGFVFLWAINLSLGEMLRRPTAATEPASPGSAASGRLGAEGQGEK